ncbi:MAG: translation initiation factor [Deltaproteobacteria bacterium]|nr:translation initiation factor [Deltaproteobacteria bacterium]
MRRRARDGDTLVYGSGAGGQPVARSPQRSVATTPAARIWLEKKGRNGTPVSIIRGLTADPRGLTELASKLKRACGTGGSAKDGEIIIQGDHRERLAALLERDGVSVKLAGG